MWQNNVAGFLIPNCNIADCPFCCPQQIHISKKHFYQNIHVLPSPKFVSVKRQSYISKESLKRTRLIKHLNCSSPGEGARTGGDEEDESRAGPGGDGEAGEDTDGREGDAQAQEQLQVPPDAEQASGILPFGFGLETRRVLK